MKSQAELQAKLREIDHKGYKAYKVLEGEYDFGAYRLWIDHVQGDPFASPSRVRIVYRNQGNIPVSYFESRHRRIAVEDYLLRSLHRFLRNGDGRAAKGSGKSGLVTACRTGQEILETTAMHIGKDVIEARIEVGFPAFGRTIAAGELAQILFHLLPDLAQQVFKLNPRMKQDLDKVTALADDQQFIRQALPQHDLAAFVADGSILPRESGVSQRPMRDAVVFKSPESLAVTLDLPHRGQVRGMGIRHGITVIAGGGFHGKSTLLKALERGVYNHISGDGRELVITDETAFKLRAEEHRCIHETDISMFINNLPNKKDTVRFCTENASGSTSQAANVVEAMEAGAQTLLIDEDTSATNFMIRDELMQRVVNRDSEPITPFIDRVQELYEKYGISTVLVAGSSGSYFHKADCIIQMDHYLPKDITESARKEAEAFPIPSEKAPASQKPSFDRVVKTDQSFRKNDRIKMKTQSKDSILINRDTIDLRYVEQLTDTEQLVTLGHLTTYGQLRLFDGKKSLSETVEELLRLLDKKGLAAVCKGNYVPGGLAMVRKQEIFACLNRYRSLKI